MEHNHNYNNEFGIDPGVNIAALMERIKDNADQRRGHPIARPYDPPADIINRSRVMEPLAKAALKANIALTTEILAQLQAGSTFTVRVRVRNTSQIEWPAHGLENGVFQIRLGNHWLDEHGTLVVFDDSRANLPRDVAPADEVEIPITVIAPSKPGQYVLELDMLQEGVCWFNETGSETLSIGVKLEAAHPDHQGLDEPMPQAMEQFADTSKSPTIAALNAQADFNHSMVGALALVAQQLQDIEKRFGTLENRLCEEIARNELAREQLDTRLGHLEDILRPISQQDKPDVRSMHVSEIDKQLHTAWHETSQHVWQEVEDRWRGENSNGILEEPQAASSAQPVYTSVQPYSQEGWLAATLSTIGGKLDALMERSWNLEQRLDDDHNEMRMRMQRMTHEIRDFKRPSRDIRSEALSEAHLDKHAYTHVEGRRNGTSSES